MGRLYITARELPGRRSEAIARYHTNAISTVEVLQELIALTKDLRAARARGEETGLTPEEIAFDDALADNASAVEILGNDQLKIIAHELVTSLQANATVDWAHRESARARLRLLVKRILRKYGYPPDLEDAAVRGVLAQALVLLARAVWGNFGICPTSNGPASFGLDIRCFVKRGNAASAKHDGKPEDPTTAAAYIDDRQTLVKMAMQGSSNLMVQRVAADETMLGPKPVAYPDGQSPTDLSRRRRGGHRLVLQAAD